MQLVEGNYQMTDNVDPVAIVKQYGSPLYLYDASIIEKQYKRMVNSFSVKKFELHYACKANTNLSILQLLLKLGSGIDCVSLEEVHLAKKAGFKASQIMYTPNSVALENYFEAVKMGVKINIDSISILEQFGQIHPEYPVCIRVNPHVMAGMYSKISVGHIDSKFGISIHQIPHVMRVIKETGQAVNGVHMHTGSDILDVELFLNAAEILLNAAKNFKELEFIDFGSGFKVPYKKEDIETDIENFGEKFSVRFNEFCKEYGRELTLVFEPGKYLVSQSGYFLAKANVVKQTTSTMFVCLNSGFNHLIRPMFYNAYHQIENISNPSGRQRIYTVVGNICETDTFGVNRRLAEVNEGDILCFRNAGAYCFSMASQYNSRPRPAEVLIYEGKDYLIRKRETMKDLVRNQVAAPILEQQIV